MTIHPRRFIGSILFAVSLVMLLWSATPPVMKSQELIFSPEDMQLLTGQGKTRSPETDIPAYRLSLHWPEKVRVGEIYEVSLVFAPLILSERQIQKPEHVTPGAGQALDDSSDVSFSIEGRLEAPNLLYTPAGQISQKLILGEPVSLSWRVQPAQAKNYPGTVWTSLLATGNGADTKFRQVLAAQEISIAGIKFLGLDSLAARLLASLGAAVGAVLSLDKVVLDLWVAARKRWKSIP